MPKKYKIFLCLSIGTIFLILYSFNDGETKLTSKTNHLPVSKARKSPRPVNLADNEDMVAAILIMPKSYLPALKQFSNSRMAKDITILLAQIELKDGQMTAVHHQKKKQPARKITPVNNPSNKPDEAILGKPTERERQIFTTGFMYFLASIHKGAILH